MELCVIIIYTQNANIAEFFCRFHNDSYLYIYQMVPPAPIFATKLNLFSNKIDFSNIKVYYNLYHNRSNLWKENKNKAGIYDLIKNMNGHDYIASSVNITNRMQNYLNKSLLIFKKNSNPPIGSALLKYGYDNF